MHALSLAARAACLPRWSAHLRRRSAATDKAPCALVSTMSAASDSASSEPFFTLHSPSTATGTTGTSASTTAPRLGSVLGRLSTPAVLTYTQHGLPPHLTIDNWTHLPDMTAFHVPLASFVSQPSAAALASPHYASPSLASYLRLPPASFVLLSLSDPLLPAAQCNDASVVVASLHGNQRVTPLQFVQRARVLRPDALLLASDEHTAASEAERGREKKAVWRSVRWLKEQMQTLYGSAETAAQDSETEHGEEGGERRTKRQRRMDRQEAVRHSKEQSSTAPESTSEEHKASAVADGAIPSLSAARHVKPPHIIAPLPLTTDTVLQQSYMKELLAHSSLVDGYSVAIPATSSDAALSLLPSVLSQLPPSSLRICSSHPPTLSSLFAAACSGLDLISTALPYHHSLLGLALSLHSPALSLHSSALATSALPLCAACSCHTCQRHTRAYLHHLLRVKEMTGTVLLDMHNTHTVLAVVRMVRDRLRSDGLQGWDEWRDEWMRRFEANERVEKEEREREEQKDTKDVVSVPRVDLSVASTRPHVPVADG